MAAYEDEVRGAIAGALAGGATSRALAGRLGVAPNLLSMLKDSGRLPPDRIPAAAAALGCDAGRLFALYLRGKHPACAGLLGAEAAPAWEARALAALRAANPMGDELGEADAAVLRAVLGGLLAARRGAG